MKNNKNEDKNVVKEHLQMDRNDKIKIASAFSLLTQIGIQVMVIIFMMFFLGRWLDNVFSTQPLFLLLCFILGVASAFRSIYVIGMNEIKKFEKNDKSYKAYKKYDYDKDDEDDYKDF